MNDYEERKEARTERYSELAAKHRRESISSWEASDAATRGIPMGQPILIGHHSEKAHRNALAKSHNAMRKSTEHTDKAEYYEEKAAATANNTAISSDDPEAVEKLKTKLSFLQEKQAGMKIANAKARKEKKDRPHPVWELQNNNGNMSRIKKRIKFLEAQSEKTTKTYEINGIELCENVELNRIQMFFPGKPSQEIRSKLKSRGFRFSPRNDNAWQAFLKGWNILTAKEIAEGAA